MRGVTIAINMHMPHPIAINDDAAGGSVSVRDDRNEEMGGLRTLPWSLGGSKR